MTRREQQQEGSGKEEVQGHAGAGLAGGGEGERQMKEVHSSVARLGVRVGDVEGECGSHIFRATLCHSLHLSDLACGRLLSYRSS